MMYHFAIIDDNRLELDLIANVLNKECQHHHLESTITTYNDPLTFDFTIKYDAIFLDIEMPQEDGFSFASRLNNYYETKIIIVTNHSEHITNIFNIHPYHFINKQYLHLEIINVCNQLFKVLEDSPYLTGYIFDRKKNIKIKNIYYIVVEDHLCYIYLYRNNNLISIRETITNIENQFLNTGLIRINRSTIINMLHIKEIKKNKIVLNNNIRLTISPAYNKHFNKHYQKYLWGLL